MMPGFSRRPLLERSSPPGARMSTSTSLASEPRELRGLDTGSGLANWLDDAPGRAKSPNSIFIGRVYWAERTQMTAGRAGGAVARCKTMLFMVIERFRPGEAPAVYRHVRDPGRIKGSFHAGPEARP